MEEVMKEPFIHPLYIIEKLETAGYEAYFVGGAVRDLILNRTIGDIDIATSARPEQVMELFPKTIHVGIEHGTVVVVHENETYEVTTFRSEGEYDDFRRPSSVTFISSLMEDLQRRDFTINAMAMNAKGEIIDPFNGREDLRNQLIRTVGNAKERFHEDALRMMRAVRFVSQLAFSLSDQTKRAIQQYGELLRHVSIERITIEFEKMLSGKRPSLALALVADTELYRYLPQLNVGPQKFQLVCAHDWMMLQRVSESWTLLVHLLDIQDKQAFFKSWKLSNKQIKEIQLQSIGLRDVLENGWSKRIMYTIGEQASVSVNRILQLLRSNEYMNEHELLYIYNELPIHSLKDLDMNGQDLLVWTGKKGGPWVSQLLKEIEEKVLYNELVNTKSSIRKWVQSCSQI
jgi:tRNA nucleotidyltransferase (CCA-adding enzyme)